MTFQVRKIAQLNGHAASILMVAKGRNAEFVFSASSDCIIAEWSLHNFQAQNFSVKLENAAYSICYVVEKNWLLIGNSLGGLHIIDLDEKKEIKYLLHHKAAVFDIQYSIHQNALFLSSADGSISKTNLNELRFEEKIQLCFQKVRKMNFNSDKSLLAVACGDCSIRIIDAVLFKELKTIPAHSLSANCVVFHPTKKILISGGRDAHLNFYNAENYELINSIPAHNFAIYDIQFSPNNQFFATASRDKTIKIWNAQTLELRHRIDRAKNLGHLNSVNSLFWSDYSNYLISCSDDKTLMVWDIQEI